MLYAGKKQSFDCCSACRSKFNASTTLPYTLGCCHSICETCYKNLDNCPLDRRPIDLGLKCNLPLIKTLGFEPPRQELAHGTTEDNILVNHLNQISDTLMQLCETSKQEQDSDQFGMRSPTRRRFPRLSEPMERKFMSLFHTQPCVNDGQMELARYIRHISERMKVELVYFHSNRWTVERELMRKIKEKGCHLDQACVHDQVIEYVVRALGNSEELTRTVLKEYICLRIPSVVKTKIDRIIQILFRSDCFDIIPSAPGQSRSLRLKPLLRTFKELRQQHDISLIDIAVQSQLRLVPEHWAQLLYGEVTKSNKSYMQSLLDRYQTKVSMHELERIIHERHDRLKVSSSGMIERLKSLDEKSKLFEIQSDSKILCHALHLLNQLLKDIISTQLRKSNEH